MHRVAASTEDSIALYIDTPHNFHCTDGSPGSWSQTVVVVARLISAVPLSKDLGKLFTTCTDESHLREMEHTQRSHGLTAEALTNMGRTMDWIIVHTCAILRAVGSCWMIEEFEASAILERAASGGSGGVVQHRFVDLPLAWQGEQLQSTKDRKDQRARRVSGKVLDGLFELFVHLDALVLDFFGEAVWDLSLEGVCEGERRRDELR